MFSEVMRYILDLGPTVMLPVVIIIFSKILGMKAGDCFKAGLHIGIGFVGIGLVIGLMLDSIGPAESDGGKFRPESACGRCRLAGLFTNDLGVANCAGGDSDCDIG